MKEKLNTLFHMALAIAIVLVIFDMIAFASWVWSGQHPIGDFYFGTLTAHIIGLIF